MICTNCDVYRNETGAWTLSFQLKGDSVRDAKIACDEFRGKDVDVTVKKHSDHRSTTANAYFHVLVQLIANKLGVDAEIIKQTLVRSYGAVGETADGEAAIVNVPKGVDIYEYYDYAVWIGGNAERDEYVLMKPTHKMTADEFRTLIDGAVAEAKELGIETLPPNELEALYGSSNV